MPPKTLILGITVLAIVIIIGGVAYTLVEEQLRPTPSSPENGQQTPTGSTTPEEQPLYPEDNTTDITPGPTTPETPADTNGTTGPSSTVVASVQEQIRDQGMAYLRTTKPETAPLMGNLSWYGGRSDLSSPGTEQFMYYTENGFWSVTVETQANSAGNYIVSGIYFNAATMTTTFKETYTNGVFTLVDYSSQRNPAPIQP
jgi:hypothetical protein